MTLLLLLSGADFDAAPVIPDAPGFMQLREIELYGMQLKETKRHDMQLKETKINDLQLGEER